MTLLSTVEANAALQLQTVYRILDVKSILYELFSSKFRLFHHPPSPFPEQSALHLIMRESNRMPPAPQEGASTVGG
jgi:hypothetical protein